MAGHGDLPEIVYKVALAGSVAPSASGHYSGMPIDARDGFIHLSTARQLAETLRLHFAGQRDLVVMAVRLGQLDPALLRWEPSRGGDLFPHYYAALPLSAVAWMAQIAVAADGTCDLPEAVR